MADDLSPSDRSSLAAERGPISMAVAGALVFEGSDSIGHEQVRRRVAERIHLIPRYRQRLETPAFGLANPVWVDDAGFDLSRHVLRASLPGPGDDAQLTAYVAAEMSRRLDRARPLWELHVIDGLAGGRVALMPKMHHALVDGIAAIDVGTVILDPTPEPLEIPAPDEPWEPRPYELRAHLRRLARSPLDQAQRMVIESASRALDTSPRRAAEDVRRGAELFAELARARPTAPMTPLNRPISANRNYAVVRASLAGLKEAGKRHGGTVNDVILAAVTGMLAEYLTQAGVELKRDPVALVPVSVRREDEQGELGNRISTVFVDLPISERNDGARVSRIASAMDKIKDSAAVRAGALLVGATGWAPPVVSAVLVRGLGSTRAFNLVVSNVPGPQQPFYLDGARLLEAFPVVPLNPANQGLSVGMLSYDGEVRFGLLADRELDPPVEAARLALQRSLARLVGAGQAA